MKQVSENEIYLVDLFALSKHLQVLFLVISARNLHKFLSCFNFHRSEQVNRKYEVVLRKKFIRHIGRLFFFNRDKLLRIVVRVLTALFPLQILTALEQETVCIFFSRMNLYAGFFLKSSARYRLSAPGNFVSRYDHVLVLKGRTFPFFSALQLTQKKVFLNRGLL